MVQKKQKKSGAWESILLAVLVSALPSFYLYARNAYKIPFTDVLFAMLFSVAAGLICLLVFWLLTRRNIRLAALLTTVVMALFLCFSVVRALVDLVVADARLRVYYGAAAAILAVLFAVILLINKKRPNTTKMAGRFLLAMLSLVYVMNLVTAVPQTVKRLSATSYSVSAGTGKDASLPNFYYILTDEYASFEEIEKYYDYDNSAFRDFLTEKGFCVSESSYNATAQTLHCIADNVNLAHVAPSDLPDADCKTWIDNGVLYGELESLGYNLSQLGTMYPLPRLLERTTYFFSGSAATMNGETAFDTLLDYSMLSPLRQIQYWNLIEADGDMTTFNYLDDPAHYAEKSNRAIFMYICSPHPPFYYTADGTQIEDRAMWTNFQDKRYYLGQYQYITSRLTQSVETILANDPGAIILIQSDHGMRYHADGEFPMDFLIEGADLVRILNALYYGGKPVDITGLSGYNTLRAVLTELGLDYPILPEG